MPELPEVETVRRGLAPVMQGARFTRVEAQRGDLRWPLPGDFVQRLQGSGWSGSNGGQSTSWPSSPRARC